MIVTSALELYTQLFAWHMYTATAYIFFGTGIAVIPFILMTINTLLDSWENDWDSESLLKTLEAKAYTMLLVIFFCFSPSINITFSGTQYAYTSCKADDEDRETVTSDGDTGTATTYDKEADKIAAIYGERQPKAPLWWYLTTKLWQATSGALIQEIPCTTDLTSITQTLLTSKIKDPALANEANQFYGDCYIKASNQFLSNLPPEDEKPSALKGDAIYDDVSWLGSAFFLEHPEYYSTMRPTHEVRAFPYSALRDSVVAPPPPDGLNAGGFPTCYEWWEGVPPDGSSASDDNSLMKRLLADVKTSSPADFEEKFMDGFNYTSDDDADQHRLRIALTSTDDEFTPLSLPNFTNAYSSSSEGEFQNVFNNVSDAVLVGAGALWKGLPAIVESTAMRHLVVIVEALAKMMFTLMLPILMWLSLYNIKTLITLTAVQFSFYMWSYIFAICYWMNNFLYGSMMTTGDALTTIKRLATEASIAPFIVLSWVIMYSYVVLPVFFSSMITLAGRNLGTGLEKGLGRFGGSLGQGAPSKLR
jgi:TraG-like protein, N-terminal region